MEEEIDELGPKTVFTIKNSEIPQGVTQCSSHSWRKLSENELACTKCTTAVIVGLDNEDLIRLSK